MLVVLVGVVVTVLLIKGHKGPPCDHSDCDHCPFPRCDERERRRNTGE